MLTAAMVLGIIGGISGIVSGLLVLMFGGIGAAFEASGSASVAWWGYVAVFLAVMGVVGGALSKAKPVPGALLQILGAVLGFVAVYRAWLIAGPLLALGGVLALVGRNEVDNQSDTGTSLEPAATAPTFERGFVERRRPLHGSSNAVPVALWVLVGVSLLAAVGAAAYIFLGDDLPRNEPVGRRSKVAKRVDKENHRPHPVAELTAPILGASSSAPSGVDACGAPTSYLPDNLMDKDPTTAWRIPGDGIGQVVELRWRRKMHIRRVGLIPGYAKVDPCDDIDRFFENRRVLKVSYAFSDGTSEIQSFDPWTRQAQLTRVETKTKWMKITILETTMHGGRDYTPISEIEAYGSRT